LELYQAVLMGIVQGLGEFLPISSSAHLVLLPWLFGWDTPGLVFDVALHMGTLVAVAAYFWRDWLVLFNEGRRGVRTKEGRLFWFLVAATIPGVVIGFFLEDLAATVFRAPILVGTMLIVMGLVLYGADHFFRREKKLYDIKFRESMAIGLSQALAIVPGVSRSGITMATARAQGVDRESAARFSFLLSAPIIFGAGVVSMGHLNPGDLNLAFVSGVVTSGIVGFLAIKFMLAYIARHSFNIFVWYRLALGTTVIVIALLRG
jgi:undecaprenyl-diphosphatase